MQKFFPLSIALFSFLIALRTSYSSGEGYETAKVSGTNSLWDLRTDPTESENLYDTDDYHDIRDYLVERLDYWQATLKDGEKDNPSDLGSSTNAYTDCGGICPYVDDSSTIEIEKKYFPENPPNIVFVLVDDWGWNDIGFRSTYMNWTTPTIDKLALEGVVLDNYFTHSFCTPTRGALLTGRFAGRLGLLQDMEGNYALPLSEVTLAQELKSAGYRTSLVGKWDLGHASLARTPTYRGFDTFYGFYNGKIDYYTKYYGSYLDLQDGNKLVTKEYELSESLHTAYLFENKAEAIISNHAISHPNSPLFLYYAMQLVHSPYEAPSEYKSRCSALDMYQAHPSISDDDGDFSSDDADNYCAMNLMLDEAIANLTCTLESYGMLENTVFIMASDNGGSIEIPGNSAPFRGHKYDLSRGGVSANAFITSRLIPEDRRGKTYTGQMHVTDWLPTIMSIATEGEWTGGYNGAVIDGVNMWDAIMTDATSPRTEIVHYVDSIGMGSIQIDLVKLDYKFDPAEVDDVLAYYPADQVPDTSRMLCEDPSIVGEDPATMAPSEEEQTPPPSEEESSIYPHEDQLSMAPSIDRNPSDKKGAETDEDEDIHKEDHDT